MAGDWIKMNTGLARDMTVKRIARTLKLDVYATIGRLHAFWSWVDEQTEDGFVAWCTPEDVDDLVQFPGFAQTLEDVKWLVITEDGISIPKFEKHNGESAKSRAEERERKRLQRLQDKAAELPLLVPQTSGQIPDKSVTREEKRREEDINDSAREREGSAISREVARTLPPALDALGDAFRDEWHQWLVFLTTQGGRIPPIGRTDLHLQILVKILEDGEDPVAALKHCRSRGLREPEPAPKKRLRRSDAGESKTPTAWELKDREEQIRERMKALSEGRKGMTYVSNPEPGQNPGFAWTPEGKAEYEQLKKNLDAVQRARAGLTPVPQALGQ